MGYGQGWAPPNSTPGGTGVISPLVLNAPTVISSTASPYTALATDHYIIVSGSPPGAVTIVMPSVAAGTVRNGQRLAVANLDLSGDTVQCVAAAGDNIETGASWPFSFWGAHAEFEAQVVGGVTTWHFVSQNTREVYQFPLHPPLVANMAAVSLGSVLIPWGVRGLRTILVGANAALTAGTCAVNVGAVGLAGAHNESIPVGFAAVGSVFSPGTASVATVPITTTGPTPIGAYVTATVTTNGAFAGPTDLATSLETW